MNTVTTSTSGARKCTTASALSGTMSSLVSDLMPSATGCKRSEERRVGMTGVQTCALPIYEHGDHQHQRSQKVHHRVGTQRNDVFLGQRLDAIGHRLQEIGRASCRDDWSSDVCSSDL